MVVLDLQGTQCADHPKGLSRIRMIHVGVSRSRCIRSGILLRHPPPCFGADKDIGSEDLMTSCSYCYISILDPAVFSSLISWTWWSRLGHHCVGQDSALSHGNTTKRPRFVDCFDGKQVFCFPFLPPLISIGARSHAEVSLSLQATYKVLAMIQPITPMS